jgi:hypothetical protein
VTQRVVHAAAGGGAKGDQAVSEYERKYGGFGYT